MTVKDDLIYEIMMCSNSGADTIIYESGKDSGFPDLGACSTVGFYHELENAIDAMHENGCDIRECVYNYGFVLKRRPGLYNLCGQYERIYFKWDEDRQGFYEAEEPERLKIIAF